MLNLVAGCSWVWDEEKMSPSVALLHGGREVFFHPDYSCGTAAVRGTEPLTQNAEHYWEIKMTSAVYGTDMVSYFYFQSIQFYLEWLACVLKTLRLPFQTL